MARRIRWWVQRGVFVLIGMVFFSGIILTSDVRAGGDWDGIPTITLFLEGKTDDGQSRCKKECAKKSDDEQGAEGKKGCAQKCTKEASAHKTGKYITIGIGDLEKYHGGVGPGIALSYRACQIAFAALYPGTIPPRKDQFVVSGSEKDCPGDVVTYITGARYGKGAEKAFNGNLVFDERVGMFSFIFASISSGKAVKLTSKFEFPEKFLELNKKKDTDPEASAQFQHMAKCIAKKVLTSPDNELYEVTEMTDFSWKECKEKCGKK